MKTNRLSVDNLDQHIDELIRGINALQLESNEDAWRPRVDIDERTDTYLLEIELPGWSIDEVRIEVTGNCLEIECERQEPASSRDFVRRERRTGKFFRSFLLPNSVQPREFAAELTDGVLTIKLRRINQGEPEA